MADEVVSEAAIRRCTVWLRRHESGRVAATPLLAARLEVGRRATAGLAIVVVTYGGAVVVSVASLVLARTPGDRSIVAVFLLGLLAFAALTVVEVAQILRRPALAEDPESLSIDDTLRVADVRAAATAQLPALLTTVTVVAVAPHVPWLAGLGLAFVGFAVVATVWAETAAPPRSLPASGTRATTP